MLTTELFKNICEVQIVNNIELEIREATVNSKKADKNTIFIAKSGFYKDGKDFCLDAYNRGCRAFLADAYVKLPPDAFFAISRNIEASENCLLDCLYGGEDYGVTFIGITGTKGKTTVGLILYKLLSDEGGAVFVGTLGVKGIEYGDIKNTTPDKAELRKIIALAIRAHKKYIIIEMSSQGLKYKRADGIKFDCAIFTNISSDHISECEHSDFYDYLTSKRRLFKDFGVKLAIAHSEEKFAKYMTNGVPRVELCEPINSKNSPIRDVRITKDGTVFCLNERQYTLSLFGIHNLSNALLATRCASMLTGKDEGEYIKSLSDIKIEGRLDIIEKDGRYFIIDYAHNPLSFSSVADLTARLFSCAKVIAVFGSVGDRARDRRKGISLIAEQKFDLSILTEDDTVYEKTEDICKEMCSYFADKSKCMIITDREKAIRTAAKLSRIGDVILLLGKGHEKSIVRGGAVYPFDEKSIISSIDF